MRATAIFRVAFAGALVTIVCAPPVFAGDLTSVTHGAVDFGDRIAYRVQGAGCDAASVQVRVTTDDGVVLGAVSQPLPDGIDPSGCTGAAEVPGFNAVRAIGWQPGDRIGIELSDGSASVPLRYARVEIDLEDVAEGAPAIVPAADQDTAENDMAMAMATGDSIGLGRVDLRNVDSVAIRLCPFGIPIPEPLLFSGQGGVIQPEQIELPLYLSLRQDTPTGPALVGPVDVSHDLPTGPRLSPEGFHGCYRLVSLEITGPVLENAPELFLTADAVPPGMLVVNSIDFNGTGAKIAMRPANDPPMMQTIFDGTSFDGWTATDNCSLRDRAAANKRNGDPLQIDACVMQLDRSVRNVVLRAELRRRNFFDNGGIYMSEEIQLRSAGEYLPGGYFTEYAARWQKLNVWPEWSEIEIVQLGARYVVTVNGRTVTDHMASTGAPAAYTPRFETQPQWAYRLGAAAGFGGESSPDIVTPKEWGSYEFRNIRLYECTSETDPVCLALANARLGQAPAK